MVRSVTIGRCNWYSLTSASPPLTKIFVRTETLMTSSHSDYLRRVLLANVWTYIRKVVCSLSSGHFDSNDSLIKYGVVDHVMQLKLIFKMKLEDFLVTIGLKFEV